MNMMKLIVLAIIVLTPLWICTVVHAQKQMVLPTPTQTKLEVLEPIAAEPVKAEEVVLVEKDRRFLQNQPVRHLLQKLNPFHRRCECGEVQCREVQRCQKVQCKEVQRCQKVQCKEVQCREVVRREVQRCKTVRVERNVVKCCGEI